MGPYVTPRKVYGKSKQEKVFLEQNSVYFLKMRQFEKKIRYNLKITLNGDFQNNN